MPAPQPVEANRSMDYAAHVSE